MSKINGLCATELTPEGLAVSVVSGALATASMRKMLEHNEAWLASKRPPSLIADYSQAIILLRPEALLASVDLVSTGLDDCGLRTPTAIVVQPWQLEMLERYASLMRLNGIARAAFTSHAKARAWAVQQAETRAAEAAYLLLRRISR